MCIHSFHSGVWDLQNSAAKSSTLQCMAEHRAPSDPTILWPYDPPHNKQADGGCLPSYFGPARCSLSLSLSLSLHHAPFSMTRGIKKSLSNSSNAVDTLNRRPVRSLIGTGISQTFWKREGVCQHIHPPTYPSLLLSLQGCDML
jgi:hypothetical protein